MTNKYEELHKQGIYISKRYYRFYFTEYKKIMFDLEDLIQEADIVILNVLKKEKYKDKSINELKKIVRKAIGQRMLVLRRDNRNVIGLATVDVETSEGGVNEVLENNEQKNNLEISNPPLYFCDIKKLLKEEEFQLIYSRYAQKKSFKQIKEHFGMKITVQGVKYLIENILKKLRKKLTKEMILL